MARKQTVITIETHRQTRISSRGKALVAWCAACGTETLMLAPAQAAVTCGTTQREVFRQIENGDLHFTEAKKGVLLICGNSLQQESTRRVLLCER